MENMNLHHLSLFMDSDIIVLNGETHSNRDSKKDIPVQSPIIQEEGIMEETEHELIFEGNFEKGVLLIYEGSHLEPALREFLFKILGAVNCSLKDIALSASESVEEISISRIQQMAPNKILVFGGMRHELMGLKRQNYEIFNDEGVEYLFADDLRLISENTPMKRLLWDSLQILFGIKK